MTLLYAEGFDWTDPSLIAQDLETTYARKQKGPTQVEFLIGTDSSIVTGRGGRGGAWDSGSSGSNRLNAPIVRDGSVDSPYIMGYAVKTPATLSNNALFLTIDLGGQTQLGIRVNSNGSITALRKNTTALGTSPTGLFTTSTWYHFEFKVTIATVGSVEFRINGVTVWTLSSVDTQDRNEGTWDGFRMFQMGNFTVYDDIYICDGAGTTNNDFLGDVVVETLFPASDGSFTDWTPSAGGPHVALIDDAPFTAVIDEADYVQSNADNALELFNYDALSAGAQGQRIYGVQVGSFARLTDFIARDMKNVTRLKDINDEVSVNDKVREDIPHFQLVLFENEPANGVPWKFRDVNKAQFGVSSGPN